MSVSRRTRSQVARGIAVALLGLVGLSVACTPNDGPQTGSQTNWFRRCDHTTDDCGALSCVCGTCTATCNENTCDGPPGTICVPADGRGSVALCDGAPAPEPLCLLPCDAGRCPDGLSCSAGLCVRTAELGAAITVDPSQRHQTLLGYGASLAYADEEMAGHPASDAIFDSVFSDLGLDVIRVRNRYEPGREGDLDPARAIVEAARERLAEPPLLFMTAGSPPAALKQNGSRSCAGDADVCTLARAENGGFDYAGFAEHWVSSLAAYAAVGIVPDYLSIQNNPDYVPASSGPNEACRFLPEEGTETVTVGGTTRTVAYPGYQEALTAVAAALSAMPAAPKLVGPEVTSLEGLKRYASNVESGALVGLACHLYGRTQTPNDAAPFAELNALAGANDLPVLQTEVRADGLTTAILVHHATVNGGASMYLQNDFVVPATSLDGNTAALIRLTADGFEYQAPYHALGHFSRRTGRGWTRVEARTNDAAVLASAWSSPNDDALTIVLVNPSARALDARLELGALRDILPRTEVTRTVFDGLEASASLGALPATNSVRLPARSIMTVALWD